MSENSIAELPSIRRLDPIITNDTTSSPTMSPSLSPTSSPTASPTKQDPLPPLCVMLGVGSSTELVPSGLSSQGRFVAECVVIAEFEGSSPRSRTLRIKAAFASVLPLPQYRSLVVTSAPLSDADVVDAESGSLNVCAKICAKRTECRCVDGVFVDGASKAPGALVLRFVDDLVRAKRSFLTLLSEPAGVVSLEMRLFDGSLAHSAKAQPIQMLPHRIGSYLLDKAGDAAKLTTQRVSIKVPEFEADDVNIRITALPLLFGEGAATERSTETCALNGVGSPRICSLTLNASLDYEVQLWNEGDLTEHVELSVVGRNENELDFGDMMGDLNKSELNKGVHAIFAMLCITLLTFTFLAMWRCAHKKRTRRVNYAFF